MLWLYSFFVSLAVWVCLLPWVAVCALLGRCPSQDLWERLGRGLAAPPKRAPRLLIHAVSAGEVNVAGSILKQLLAERGDIEVLLSVGNRAGKETGRRLRSLYPQIVGVLYLPWDRHRATRRWLALQEPDVVCVVETEIWPNLFRSCRSIGIPLYILNGRIYARDVFGYRLVRSLMRRVLAWADWIGVQSESERVRFIQIGAPANLISVVGNAKFEPVVQPGGRPVPDWSDAQAEDSGPVILAACTHRPEERLLLEACSRLQASVTGVRLVLAPRDVGRCARITRSARRAGFRVKLWSEGPLALFPGEILVVDKMGALPDLYAHADVVFVGGSLARRGGHNLLEPASLGKPIVIGPHSYNFADVVERLKAAQALIELTRPSDLLPALQLLLLDPVARRQYGEHARQASLAGRGAASRYAIRLSLALTP